MKRTTIFGAVTIACIMGAYLSSSPNASQIMFGQIVGAAIALCLQWFTAEE